MNFRKTAQQTETEKSAQMDLLSTESPFLFEKNIKSTAEEENQMPTLFNENEILNDLNVRIHANNLAKVPTDVFEQLQLDTDTTKRKKSMEVRTARNLLPVNSAQTGLSTTNHS